MYVYSSTATGEQFDEFDEDDDLDSIDMEECYVVKRDYTRLSMDELDVYEGQMVCIIDDSDRGRWFGMKERERERGGGEDRE